MDTGYEDKIVGQLDEISAKIGELLAGNKESRHGIDQLTAKFDAMRVDVAKEFATLDVKLTARIEATNAALSERIKFLEDAEMQRKGAVSVIHVILKSPALAWLVGAAITAWAVLDGKIKL